MKQKINVSVDEEIIEWIKKKAKENHLNFSAMINQMLWKIKNGRNKSTKGSS